MNMTLSWEKFSIFSNKSNDASPLLRIVCLTFLTLVLSAGSALAVPDHVTVTAATNGSSISADETGVAWTTLTGPILAENNSGNIIGTGTIILTAPSGFVFNTGVTVTVKITTGSGTAGNNINNVALNSTYNCTISSDGTRITNTITATSGAANTIQYQNIQVRPTAGTPLASGNLTESGTAALSGLQLSSGTWGALAEVVGNPAQVAFIQQPSTVGLGATISPAVTVLFQDQFGSTVSTNGSVTMAIGTNPGGGTLGGTTTVTASAGTATFSTLTINKAGTGYTLQANSTGLTSDTSSSFNITNGNTTTTVTSGTNPSTYGQSVTFTATVAAVSPATGTPSGTVTFLDGTTPLATNTLSSGSVTFVTSALNVAAHTIKAVYNGDSNFRTSTNTTTLTQTVNQTSSTNTVTSSANPSVYGQNVIYTATITATGTATATGTVTFKDGATTIGTGSLSANQATFSTNYTAIASHSITAAYPGDTNVKGSTNSPALTQIVNKSGSTTAVGSSANPSVSGQSVTYTVNVTATSPGSGTPTGNVVIKDNGTAVKTNALSSGSTTYSTNYAAAGAHAIVAEYGGDSSFNASTNSPALAQTVNAAATTTALGSSVNPSVSGQSVTFTATVTVNSPGSGTPTGTVTFKDGATTLGTGAVSGGLATFATSGLSTTTHSITAVYGGDSNFSTSTSSSVSQVVNAANTATALSSSVNPSVSGQSVTFTATVTASSPGSGTPTGTVTFKDGATTIGTGALSGGLATFATNYASAGSHSITAVYGADSNFNTSTSSTLTQTVNKAATTTTVNADVNPSVSGQAVTFTATVAVTSPGSGTVTGTVTFKDGAATVGTGVLSGGSATFATNYANAGSHSITAVYGGDGNFNTSTSSALSQTVNAANTTTAVGSSANPSVSGQPVTFTATVTATAPGSGTPTGTITFKDGATTIGTGALSGGSATFATNYANAGSHSITAVYGGSTDFNTSTSSALTQAVNAANTTTAVTSGTNPSVSGQSVTFTATVTASSPGSGAPTGTVTFKDGATTLGTGSLSGGSATFSTSALSTTSHSITAVYGADSNFNTSTSSILTQTVNAASTTTAVSSSANPSVSGQSVTFTATVSAVSPASGTPTGTVTFKDGATTLGTGTVSGGTATFATSSLSTTSHSITAVYGADSNFNTSTSSALTQNVNAANTTTAVTSGTNPSVSGQSVTFTATVSASSPGSGTPTGTVTFKDGATTLGTGSLSGGTATFATSALSTTSHSITAVYGASTDFNTSTSSALTQTVNAADTTTVVSSSANPSVSGQSVTFTATVTATSPGGGTPAGTVTFKDGATTLGTGPLSGGTATFATSSLNTASHSITAVYGASADFNTSTSSTLSQVVGAGNASVAVTSSVNPSIVNQSVTVTATVTAGSPATGSPTGTIQFVVDGIYFVGSPVALSAGAATSGNLPGLTQGDHTVAAIYSGDSNFNSVTNTLTQTVTAPLATCTASNSGPVCEGGTLQLFGITTDTGSDVYYSWAGPNGFTSTNQNPTIANVTANDAGTFTLTTGTTGTTNCIEMTVVSVAPTLAASVSADTVCTGASGNITANASGGTAPYSYAWSPGGATTQTISVTDGGLYTVTVIDSTGTSHCSVQASGALTLKALPACAINGANTVCPNSTNSYSAPAGMSSYTWSVSGAATIDGAANAQSVSVVAAAGCNTNFSLSLNVTSNGCSSACSTNINVIDTTAPAITSVPADATVSCANAVPAANDGAVVASDDCSSVTVTHLSDSVTSSNCPNNFTVTRTYVATDACGNSSIQTQTITVHDATGPVITGFPADATYSCSASVPAADDGAVSATDACGGSISVTHSDDAVTAGSCANRYTIARTYTATDACGNATTQTQNITVNDSTAPVLAGVPADVTAQCNAVPTAATPTATDNCDSNPSVSFNETSGAGSCANSYVLTRTWTATDACGNSSSGTQHVTVIDTTAPVLAGVPADATVQCDAVPTAASPTATDNCDSNPTISFSETNAPGSCAGSSVLTRVWTATDVCGNSSTATQTITVIDTTAPVLAGVPADATVQCDSIPAAASPTGTDTCDTNASVSLSESTVAGSCANNYVLTRTWTATDACGNSSSASQTINVIDTTAPVIAGVPADATVQCDSVPAAATPTATDTCDANPSISFDESSAAGSCANSYVLTRTWTATDACGNTSTAAQTITVIDTTAPVIAGVPADATVQCDAVPTAATATATDTCDSNPTISLNESSAAGTCANSYVLTRVWTATDVCGNSSTATQTITVIDTVAPVLAGVPADATAQCNAVPTAATPTATDTCDSNPHISFNESSATGSCAGSYVLTRTWTASDACGNSSSSTQHVTVIDTTAPVLAGVPADATVQCDAVTTAASPTATDNCDSNPTISFSETNAPGSCAGSSVLTRVWTATDVCGNSSTATQTITVIDTTAPLLAGVPADATVQCDAVPLVASPTATDNCDTNAAISFNQTSAAGSCTNSYVLTRTWTATDACGNSSSASQTITVIDTTAPVIAGVPAAATVQCDAVPTAASPTATDTCDNNPSISFNESSAAGSCSNSYVLTRTWTATDACGNTSTAAQTITVIDSTAPVIAGVPADVTVQCDAVPTAATPTATDTCDSAPVVSLAETISNGATVGQFVITRTWTATDACGNTSTAAQHITAFDSIAPALAGVPADTTVECSAISPAATPTASDNCDPHPVVSVAESTAAGSCAGSFVLTRTWTATDASGNSSSASQTITVHDTTAPTITGVPADATVQCDVVPTAATLTATDNCDTNATVSMSETRVNGTCTNSYTLSRTWTATDACGNSSSATQTITVIDTTAPVITGVPSNTTVQCDSVPGAASPTATDGCDSNPTLTFNESTVNGSCAGNYVITRTWTATDICGNSSVKTQTITVHDTIAPIIAGVPADVTVQCNAVSTAATATATDNCDSNPTVSFAETTATGPCAGSYVLTRTWTATDVCGNSSTAAQHITVIDTIAPVLAGVPTSTTAQCNAIPTAATPTATDNCDSNPHVSLNESTVTGSCANSYVLTRTWTATDACGNHSSASQTITVIDTTGPVLAGVPANTTAQCGSVPTAATPTATDTCDNNPHVTLSESTVTGSCAGNYVLTRTWTATDACGNSSTASQTITVSDSIAPVLAGVPPSTTAQCSSVPTAATPTASDNCDSNPHISFNESSAAGSCANSYVLTRTWTATDACGNSSSATQTVTVVDTTAPVLAGVPANTTAQCSAVPPAATPTATDNCDSNPNVSMNQTTTAGSSANNYTITRTWTATDACGNTSTGHQIITVMDSTAPALVGVPASTTATCALVPTAPTLTATDNCDATANVALVESSTQTGSGCSHDSYTITRTWTATDSSGNTSTGVQTITVTPVAPVITGFPANATYSCASSVPAANDTLVTAGDACGAAVAITHDADVISGQTCANHYTITRTYHATSACGTVVSQSQTITVDDSTAPTITGFPADATYTSINQIPAANDSLITATDNCGAGVTVTHSADATVNVVDAHHFQVQRTYTATDACGNATSQTQTFTINSAATVTVTITGSVDVVTNKPTWTFHGTASGENPIASIHYSLNGGADHVASGTATWTTPQLTLLAGTNRFAVYAVDNQNNQSTISNAVVFYATSNKLVVVIQDWPHKGNASTASILPSDIVNKVKKVMIGKTYSLTAVPKTNRHFLGWFDSTNANATLFSTDLTFAYVFDPTKTLVARFEDPFYYIKGNYSGLFSEPTVRSLSAGYISISMPEVVDPSANKFSAKVINGGQKTSVSAKNASFDMTGHSHFTAAAMTVDLYADLSSGFTGVITGTVTTVSWTANVTLYRDINKTEVPAAARFTMALPPQGDSPNGYGYGAINRVKSGNVAIAGTMADGSAWVAQAGKPSADGHFPLFGELYKKNPNGVLWGWLQFTGDQQGVTGNLYWFRPASVTTAPATPNFPAGITNTNIVIIGSPYSASTISFNDWTKNGVVFLYDGNRKGVTNIVTKALGVVQDPNYNPTNKVVLKITATTGLMGTSFQDPNDKKTDKIKGVVLQNQSMAAGLFYRTNAGQFLLQELP